jgi:hypothetical protein
MEGARPTSSLLFAEERELGLGFRELLKSFSLAFVDQLTSALSTFLRKFLFSSVRYVPKTKPVYTCCPQAVETRSEAFAAVWDVLLVVVAVLSAAAP